MIRYNTLIVESVCPFCFERTNIKIQFRYGKIWDYIYYVNDEIKWGEEDAGTQGKTLVVLDGAGEECEACLEAVDYLIFVEKDIIKSVRQNQGEYQFFGDFGFIVLED